MGKFVVALWIVFDVGICLRTGYMTAPFPQIEWWLWLGGGIALAIFAIIAEHVEHRDSATQIAGLKDQIANASGRQEGKLDLLAQLQMVMRQSGVTPEEMDKTLSELTNLKADLERYKSIMWMPLTERQKSGLAHQLQAMGKHSARVTCSEHLDCVALAADLRDCFEVAGWTLERAPMVGGWASAVASGLMLFGKSGDNQKPLKSNVLRALMEAVGDSFNGINDLNDLQEMDYPDIAVLVGPKKSRNEPKW